MNREPEPFGSEFVSRGRRVPRRESGPRPAAPPPPAWSAWLVEAVELARVAVARARSAVLFRTLPLRHPGGLLGPVMVGLVLAMVALLRPAFRN